MEEPGVRNHRGLKVRNQFVVLQQTLLSHSLSKFALVTGCVAFEQFFVQNLELLVTIMVKTGASSAKYYRKIMRTFDESSASRARASYKQLFQKTTSKKSARDAAFEHLQRHKRFI